MELTMESVEYDRTGKINLDKVYNRDEPTAYFSTLSKLDYSIPQAAKPMFDRVIKARRATTRERKLKVVDIGCSYGVNAALLKHGLTMAELYQLYTQGIAGDRAALLKRDKSVFADADDGEMEVIGIDQARNAVEYAVDAGAMDAGIATDLENTEPTARDRQTLDGADLIISTGCFGYVTQKSLERLLKAAGKSRPWMAHFVLRMFDFDRAATMLERHGYVTEKAQGLFRQRRFASDEEKQHVLDNLAERKIDPKGAEETGWYFAELYVARPKDDADKMPLAEMMAGAAPASAN